MSTDFYAGQLCATHIGNRVKHPDLPDDLGWVLFEVRHIETKSTIRIMCRAVGHPGLKNESPNFRCLILTPDDVVNVAVR